MGHGRDKVAFIKLRDRLKNLGFIYVGQNGSHIKYKHPDLGYSFVLTSELNTVIYKRLTKEIDRIEEKILTNQN